MSRTYRFNKDGGAPEFVRSLSKRFSSKKAKRLPKYHAQFIEINTR